MYNHLVNATKKRLLDELKEAFAKHPAFKSLEIFNRFPYSERIQEGVILKNTSANRMPLSADNFQGSVFSYVAIAKHSNFSGLSIEWVREDEPHLSVKIFREDYSHQFTQSNRHIILTNQMVKGGKDLAFANGRKDVSVYINNEKISPELIDGENKTIVLVQAPSFNSTVEVTYWKRNLTPSGLYQIEIVDGDPNNCDPANPKFAYMVDPLLDKEELLIEESTGNETSTQLSYYPIFPNSLRLWENEIIMEKDEYAIDDSTGIITFNNNLLTNANVRASYRIQGLSLGPYEIPGKNQASNAIPGIVLAFGLGMSIGDKMFLVVNKERELTAQEYGGKWEMTLSLDVYAKDSLRIEEIVDYTTSYLNAFRKSDLDAEGIALVDVSFGGESEEIFDESTGDLYYMGSVDYSFLTEWMLHKPLIQTIEGVNVVALDISLADPERTGWDGEYERIK